METVKKYLHRYFIEAMSAMALGLFASLLIGTIFGTVGKYTGLEFFNEINTYASAASGMAIYHFSVSGNDWTARMQLDIPLAGAIFAPQFGQSYYEIFGLGHANGVVAFTHPFNCPMWRYIASLDIPLRWRHHSSTLRIAYTGDIYQSQINEIRSHIYRHALSIGFVKTIFKVKQENSIKRYSPY